MNSVWNAQDQRALQERIGRLDAAAPARWGKFTAPQMVVHLCDALKMASGELPVPSKKLPIRHTPLKQLIICWLPFPKSAPTAPQLLERVPAAWPADIAELQRRLADYARRGPSATISEHPAFGAMTPKLWGVLVYRHTDHHLRQFGV